LILVSCARRGGSAAGLTYVNQGNRRPGDEFQRGGRKLSSAGAG
jgi:hypothetical protein